MSEPEVSNPMPPTFQGVILPFEQPKMPKPVIDTQAADDKEPTSLNTALTILGGHIEEIDTKIDALRAVLDEVLIKLPETGSTMIPYSISPRDSKVATQLIEHANQLMKAEHRLQDLLNRCQL